MRHSEIAIRLPEAMQSERKVGLALLRCEGEGMGACAYDVHRYTPRKGGGTVEGPWQGKVRGSKYADVVSTMPPTATLASAEVHNLRERTNKRRKKKEGRSILMALTLFPDCHGRLISLTEVRSRCLNVNLT